MGKSIQEVKALAMIMNPGANVLPDIKLPKKRKPRAKELLPRKQPERELRYYVIKILRERGCKVKRVENGLWGKNNNSIPDLLVFNPKTKFGGFIELKSEIGVLSEGQKEFQEDCLLCNINHIVCRKISDLEPIFINRENV